MYLPSISAKLLRLSMAVTGLVFAVLSFGFAQVALAESPTGCSADNSVVNISSDKIVAEEGETITFTVSAGNPASLDGCDIENRTVTVTLPDGSTTDFGPANYPNPTPTAAIGSVPYIADAADMVGGLWTANVTWDGTLKAITDLNSSGSKNASVNEVISLEVSKDAVPSFDRTFTWDITKDVDVDTHNLLTGQSDTSTYTIGVDKTTVDDNYAVTGTITIYNPNDSEVAYIESVSDVIDGYGDADEVTCGVDFPFELAPGETLECEYTSMLPDDTTRTNTATVEVTNGSLVSGGSGTADIDFAGVNPNIIGFDEVTITDTNGEFAAQNGGDPVMTNDDTTYNYDVEFACDRDEGERPNIATITETGQSDDALVTVTCSNPSILVEKTGDNLSKIGDDTTYSFTITNQGDTDLFMESVDDDVIGDLTSDATDAGCAFLAAGESCQFDVLFTVPEGANDPLENEVTVLYNTMEGLDGAEVSSSDTHSLNLFQPSVMVTKNGPSTAAVGDTVTYDYTIENMSSSDAPDLILVSVLDDVIGDITTEATNAGCDTLGFGDSCNFTVDYTIQGSDPNPLVNIVDVLYNPEGFPNEIMDDDAHTISIETLEFAGCTPGFWKNHTELWANPYMSDDLFATYFEDAFPGSTLLDVLGQGGGGLIALGRHTVAALLNAAHTDVPYPMSTDEIINAFNDIYPDGTKQDYNALKDIFEGYNQIGCSIDAHGNTITDGI